MPYLAPPLPQYVSDDDVPKTTLDLASESLRLRVPAIRPNASALCDQPALGSQLPTSAQRSLSRLLATAHCLECPAQRRHLRHAVIDRLPFLSSSSQPSTPRFASAHSRHRSGQYQSTNSPKAPAKPIDYDYHAPYGLRISLHIKSKSSFLQPKTSNPSLPSTRSKLTATSLRTTAAQSLAIPASHSQTQPRSGVSHPHNARTTLRLPPPFLPAHAEPSTTHQQQAVFKTTPNE
jgi:hypothetical protein